MIIGEARGYTKVVGHLLKFLLITPAQGRQLGFRVFLDIRAVSAGSKPTSTDDSDTKRRGSHFGFLYIQIGSS